MRNKDELIQYIQSYNKKPGEYTKDEILEIGRQMRSLPRSEISWP